MQRRVCRVKGLYLSILFVFRVPPEYECVFSLFAFGQQRTNVHTVLRPGASVPRAWWRWRKVRSPGLCEVSSSFYLSRHQILLVPTCEFYHLSSRLRHRVAYLLLRSFVSHSGRLPVVSAVAFDVFLLSSWVRSSPLLSSSANAKSVLCVTSP